MCSCLTNRNQNIITEIPDISPARMRIWQKRLLGGSNSVIYDLFTRNVNFPLWYHYLRWQYDVIKVKKIHEILRHLFEILTTHLDNTPNKPSRFKTKNWVEISDDSRGAYNTNSQIKFKIAVLKSSLWDYVNACILVKGTVSVANTAAAGTAAHNANSEAIFKNCAPFTDCVSEINNAQVDTLKTLM